MTAKSRLAFNVAFSNESLKALEPYVLAVDLGTELFQNGSIGHRTNTVIIWLQDDINNCVNRTVKDHVLAGNEQFQLTVTTIGVTGRTLDMFVCNDAQLNAMQHSIFSREDHSEQVDITKKLERGYSERMTGVIRTPASRETSAKLLQVAFSTMEHHVLPDIIQ